MTETIGNRVGVFRRNIPLLRTAIFFALVFALVTGVAIVLTRGPDTDLLGYIFAYVMSWSLVMACLWLIRSISKVTVFENGIRGPTGGFGFRTLAWDDISSVVRMPMGLRSLGIGFDAALCLQGPGGHRIVITEPLHGMQELKALVRRHAGEDHSFTRLLHGR